MVLVTVKRAGVDKRVGLPTRPPYTPLLLVTCSGIDTEASAVGSRSPGSSTSSTNSPGSTASTTSASSSSSSGGGGSTSGQEGGSDRRARQSGSLPEAGAPRFLPLPLPSMMGDGGDKDSSDRMAVPVPVRWSTPPPPLSLCARNSVGFAAAPSALGLHPQVWEGEHLELVWICSCK